MKILMIISLLLLSGCGAGVYKGNEIYGPNGRNDESCRWNDVKKLYICKKESDWEDGGIYNNRP